MTLGKRVTEPVMLLLLEQLMETSILACHKDHVLKLPVQAVLLGGSKHCNNEIWSISNQILCFQSHPEFNASYIQQLIIDKRYDSGLLDDAQKKEAETATNNNEVQLQRHTMNKVIY